MNADRLPCLASFLKSFHSVSCYRATAHGRNLFCTGGMCAGGQQCFRLPPLLSIPVPSGRASSANAGPCTVRALLDCFFGFPPLRRHRRRRARCEKNERRGERTYFSCKRGGSPRHEPRGFCGPRIWPTRQRTKRNISAVFNCSFGGFPPFLSTATRD